MRSSSLRVLSATSWIVLTIGAAGSLGMMFYTGRHNRSVTLLALFTGWVSAPFVGLLVANALSNRWTMFERTLLYSVMLVVTAASLIVYGGVAFGPPRSQPAFFFLSVPLASWVLIGLAALAVRIRNSKM